MSIPIIKQYNSDFIVHEVSLIPHDLSMACPEPEHTIVEMAKEGYTTFEAMNLVAKYFAVASDGIHCQGLKDEDGVTLQFISIEGVYPAEDMERFSAAHASLEKGWIRLSLRGYSAQPVQEKRLHANVFTVTVRGLTKTQAEDLQQFCDENSDFICLNYYDQQRFGLPGGPYIAHKIGKAIIDHDWSAATDFYRESGNADLDFLNGLPEGFNVRQLDPRKLQFFVSAFSSAEWNLKLSSYVSGDSFEIFDDFSARALTGTDKPPLLLEDVGYRLQPDMTVENHRKQRASTLSTTLYASSAEHDDANDGSWKMTFDFMLPTGSYATMALKQLLQRCGIDKWQIGHKL